MPPWWAEKVARDSLLDLEVAARRRSARLDTAMSRDPAFNAVAADRLIEGVRLALAPDVAAESMRGDRYRCLVAGSFAPARPAASNDDPQEALAIGLHRCLVVAGKKLDWRSRFRSFEVPMHALARLAERGGIRCSRDMSAIVTEGAAAADTITLAILQRGMHLLADGSLPIMVPGGFGAFLGFLRLLPSSDPRVPFVPVIEAHTWLSRDLFSCEQADFEDQVAAAMASDAAFDDLVAAAARLRLPRSGDRRIAAGLRVVAPGEERSALFRKQAQTVPAVAFLRLSRRLASPDQIAWERRAARLAA